MKNNKIRFGGKLLLVRIFKIDVKVNWYSLRIFEVGNSKLKLTLVLTLRQQIAVSIATVVHVADQVKSGHTDIVITSIVSLEIDTDVATFGLVDNRLVPSGVLLGFESWPSNWILGGANHSNNSHDKEENEAVEHFQQKIFFELEKLIEN
jgi:hypothetical protein